MVASLYRRLTSDLGFVHHLGGKARGSGGNGI
ncbi:hypothetical protein A8U91_01021 [Halomonas elongata]|uniref:Uncharacterized protein n=1 Tax=Halomonas elongata TaxID=2746 RepID=A0A1B8P371_HALEL|nr:hypothetical protein A8U91_01021 [Halomonas elongata]